MKTIVHFHVHLQTNTPAKPVKPVLHAVPVVLHAAQLHGAMVAGWAPHLCKEKFITYMRQIEPTSAVFTELERFSTCTFR